jgi:hypothetical protein
MIIQKKLNISLSGNTLPMPVRVVEADNAYQLILKYIDFDIPEGAVATMFVKKPSGKFVYQEDNISIEGNVVTIDVDNQAIIEDGISPFQVELKKDGKILTTFINYFHVEKNLKNPNAEESKTVIRALDALIDEKYEELMGRLSSLGVKGFTTIKTTNNDSQNYFFIKAKNAESTLLINAKNGISVTAWENGDTGEGTINIQCDEKYFDEKYGTQEGVSEELKSALKTYFTNMKTLLTQIAYTTENNLGNTLVQNAKDVVSALDNMAVAPEQPEQPEIGIIQTGSVLAITSGVTATQTGSELAIA